jgi:hypothetical protein
MLFDVTYKCNACHDKGVIHAADILNISSGGSVAGLSAAIQETGMSSLYANTLAMNPTDLADVAAYIALGSAPNRDQHGFTGSWYEPATSGQGIEVEVYPSTATAAGSMFESWFTYDTVAGGADHERWYTAFGSMVFGEPIVPLTIYQNTGGNFDAPPTTNSQPVGTATLYFDTCTSGAFSYTFSDAERDLRYHHGRVPYQCRLRSIRELVRGCYLRPGIHGGNQPDFQLSLRGLVHLRANGCRCGGERATLVYGASPLYGRRAFDPGDDLRDHRWDIRHANPAARAANGARRERDAGIPKLHSRDVQLQVHRGQQQRPVRDHHSEPRRPDGPGLHVMNLSLNVPGGTARRYLAE